MKYNRYGYREVRTRTINLFYPIWLGYGVWLGVTGRADWYLLVLILTTGISVNYTWSR
jgi:hypothetical protein